MSDPANWSEWIKVAAFMFGLVFGGFAVGSPAWVWLKKQLLSPIAGWLATLGTVMITMSIWQSVEIEAPGLRMRIADLRDALLLQTSLAEQDPAALSARLRELGITVEPSRNPEQRTFLETYLKVLIALDQMDKLKERDDPFAPAADD